MLTLTAHQFSVPGDAKTWGKLVKNGKPNKVTYLTERQRKGLLNYTSMEVNK